MSASHIAPLTFTLGDLPEISLRVPNPISLEFHVPGDTTEVVAGTYDEYVESDSGARGTARVAFRDWEIAVRDEWTTLPSVLRVHRSISVLRTGTGSCGVRASVIAELDADGERFDDGKYYAPPALYNLNDIDEDGLEDYVGSRELVYRDDRLQGFDAAAVIEVIEHMEAERLPAFEAAGTLHALGVRGRGCTDGVRS